MKLHLINYASQEYEAIQERLNDAAWRSNQFDMVRGYRRDWLEASEFYRDHKGILDMPRGGGYWAWKPFVLLTALESLADGDVVVYQDCGDEFRNYGGLRERLLDALDGDNLLLAQGLFKNAHWTKRDCFILMGCDTAVHWNVPQVEAGIIVARNTRWTKGFLAEWLQYCKMPQVLTDSPNICGQPNLPGFREHRHDQSILTNLAAKHWLHPSRDLGPLGNLIDFNRNAP